MPSLFEALHESHELQRTLCRRLLRIQDDLTERASVFLELKRELEAHAAAEERFLYAPILMNDGGLWSARHALSEHHVIEELTDDMSIRGKSGGAWMARAKKLSLKVHHHLREEERKFFKVAGRILGEREKASLAKLYVKDYERMKKMLGGK